MRKVVEIIAIFVFVLLFLFVVIYTGRIFSNATTPITLHTPKQGITCAAMVTSDGAAISCWKD